VLKEYLLEYNDFVNGNITIDSEKDHLKKFATRLLSPLFE
jgi:hypothetical protein